MSNDQAHEIRLRVESVKGSPINDYRIRNGHIEMRSLAPTGRVYSGAGSDWRMMDENEIQLHYALRTVVSEWISIRLAENDFALDRAA